ncbi:MAG: bacteriorhodopsin [Caulobacteraceae bacterium]
MSGAIWLWIGFWGMAIGFAVLALLCKSRTEEEANTSVIHTIVPAIAAVLYLLMALGQGAIALDGGSRLFYFARYIDWSITTPLLLLGLAFTALGSLKGKIALVSAMVFSDLFMIITGFFAGASPSDSAAKWIWYIVSCGFFLAVYYVIWVPLYSMAKVRSAETAKIYQRNAIILSVLWFFYPIVFILGSEGVKTIAPALELAAFAILDLLAKVGYGIFSVGEHKSVAKRS